MREGTGLVQGTHKEELFNPQLTTEIPPSTLEQGVFVLFCFLRNNQEVPIGLRSDLP